MVLFIKLLYLKNLFYLNKTSGACKQLAQWLKKHSSYTKGFGLEDMGYIIE